MSVMLAVTPRRAYTTLRGQVAEMQYASSMAGTTADAATRHGLPAHLRGQVPQRAVSSGLTLKALHLQYSTQHVTIPR